jgi:hypothetical protein
MVLVAYSKSEPSSLRWKNYSVLTLNGNFHSQAGPSFGQFSLNRSLSGYKNSSWRQQIELGQNATTPLTASETTLDYFDPAEMQLQRKDAQGTWLQTWYVDTPRSDTYDGSLLSTVDNLARTNAIRKLSSNFKGYTFLGELREAVSMVRNPAHSLRKGLDSYMQFLSKKRSRLNGRKGLDEFRKIASGTWLEYSFGWRPLIGDIQAGFDAIRDRASRPEYQPFKVSVTRDRQTPRRLISSSGFQYMTIDTFMFSREECSAYYQGTAKAFVTTSGLPEKLGLYPSEFIPTAWELVPWSFVVDYFANIGDILDCWATAQRLTYGYVTTGTRKLVTSTQDVVARPTIFFAGNKMLAQNGGQIVVSTKAVTRSNITTIPLPQFALKFQLSNSKLLNLAALALARKKDLAFSPGRY